MTQEPKRINHLGIAVKSLEEGLAVWRDGLGLKVAKYVEMPEKGLKIAVLPCGETMIELLAPLGDNSEIQAFLDKRGGGLHHVCLEVADIVQATAHASAHGLALLGQAPTIGAEGLPVRFAHPKSTAGALVEWLETAPRDDGARD